jgi:Holliday junction resolvase
MSAFQTKIKTTFEKNGWYVINLIKTNKNGITDLICIKNGVSIFIESKEIKDTLKPLQKFRIDELNQQKTSAICLQKSKGITYGNIIDSEIESYDTIMKIITII